MRLLSLEMRRDRKRALQGLALEISDTKVSNRTSFGFVFNASRCERHSLLKNNMVQGHNAAADRQKQ